MLLISLSRIVVFNNDNSKNAISMFETFRGAACSNTCICKPCCSSQKDVVPTDTCRVQVWPNMLI